MSEILQKDKPSINKEGYTNSYLGDWKSDGEIFSRMRSLSLNLIDENSSKNDSKILKKIFNRIKEIDEQKEVKDDDFLPKGFEDNEAKNLNLNDFLKYVAYRYRYNLFPKLKIIEKYPPCVQIELTSICNFRCVMCYQIDKTFSNKSHGHMGMMSLDNYKRIIDELENNVQAITLASRGEPLLHPKIKDILSYKSNNFLGFKINTNASMLNEKLAHEILSSGVNNLVFSVDAADKTTYEKIRINGNFEKVFDNIKMFNSIRKKHYSRSKIITKVSGVKISSKQQSIEDMINFWKEYVDEVAFVHYNPWESAYDNDVNDISSPCSDLWRRMFIWHDGKINPCDYDYKSTIFAFNQPTFPSQSISDIWNSDLYNHLRIKHTNQRRVDIEPCKRCVSI